MDARNTTAVPNVLFFYADDWGIGDIGASGFATTLVSTPNVDSLARGGMRFTRMYAGSSLCAPSRYSVLTGNLALRAAVGWSVADDLSVQPGQLTTGHLFAHAGYATALVGKTHLGGGLYGSDVLRGIKHGRSDGRLGFEYVFESTSGIQAREIRANDPQVSPSRLRL